MDYQLTQEDMDFLNSIDMGYVGLSKPRIQIVPDEGDSVPYWSKDAIKDADEPERE